MVSQEKVPSLSLFFLSETASHNEKCNNFSVNNSEVIETTRKKVACNETQHKTVQKPAVFLKQMEQRSFKEYWKKTYPSVEIRGSVGPDNTAEITLQSPDEIEDALSSLYSYHCNEMSFKDVKNTEHVDREALIQMLHAAICSIMENEQDVVYDINEKTGRIGVCSLHLETADEIIQKIKRCIKCRTIERKENDLTFDDQLVQSLKGSFIERGKQYVSFALQTDKKLVIYMPKSHLDECYKEVKIWLHDKNMLPFCNGEGASSCERVDFSVKIRSPIMHDLISKLQTRRRFCWKETVEVAPIEKAGFTISGPLDEVKAITEELNKITRDARALSIDLEIEKESVSSFSETLHSLDSEYPVIVERGHTAEHVPTNTSEMKTLQQRKIKWYFPNGHTVRLAEVCTVHEKKAHVVFTEDTKQSKHI